MTDSLKQQNLYAHYNCYECEWFDDNHKSDTHMKCLLYQTYIHTPEKAQRCKHRLHFLGEIEK